MNPYLRAARGLRAAADAIEELAARNPGRVLPLEPLLTAAEVAGKLRCSLEDVLRLAEQGELGATVIKNKHTRFPLSGVRALLERGRVRREGAGA